jgi:hypothetical protein
VFPQKPVRFVTVLTIRTVALLQLPAAGGVWKVGTAGHSITLSAAQEIVGACRLVTVTWKWHETDCPAPSVAVQVTVVVPMAKTEPDAGLQTMIAIGTSGHPGEALGVNVTVASHRPAAVFTLRLDGQVIVGGPEQHWRSTGFEQAAPKTDTRRWAW